jgi:hypothetical protein
LNRRAGVYVTGYFMIAGSFGVYAAGTARDHGPVREDCGVAAAVGHGVAIDGLPM